MTDVPGHFPAPPSPRHEGCLWGGRGVHSPLVVGGDAAEGRVQAVYVEGHVALIAHELLVGVLLAPAQVAGAHPAGPALVVLAVLAGGPALPWTQEVGSALAEPARQRGDRSPHPARQARKGRARTHFALGFQPRGPPRPGGRS